MSLAVAETVVATEQVAAGQDTFVTTATPAKVESITIGEMAEALKSGIVVTDGNIAVSKEVVAQAVGMTGYTVEELAAANAAAMQAINAINQTAGFAAVDYMAANTDVAQVGISYNVAGNAVQGTFQRERTYNIAGNEHRFNGDASIRVTTKNADGSTVRDAIRNYAKGMLAAK